MEAFLQSDCMQVVSKHTNSTINCPVIISSNSCGSLPAVYLNRQHIPENYCNCQKLSKIIKQKDVKILNLTEKLKSTQCQLDNCRSKNSSLEYDLNFFKSKIEQELDEGTFKNDKLEFINGCLRTIIVRMDEILSRTDKSIQYFAKFAKTPKQGPDSGEDQFQRLNQLTVYLQLRINQITTDLLSKSEQLEKKLEDSISVKMLDKSVEDKRQSGTKYIDSLIELYEAKVVNYKQQMDGLRRQKSSTKEVIPDKSKLELLKEIYECSKKEYKVDFESMSKEKVSILCIKLFSKSRNLARQKDDLQKEVKHLKSIGQESQKSKRVTINEQYVVSKRVRGVGSISAANN